MLDRRHTATSACDDDQINCKQTLTLSFGSPAFQAQLLRWQLACAAMVVLATLLFLGLGHLALAYTAAMVKMAAIATAVSATAVTAVYAAVALLCYRMAMREQYSHAQD